MVLRETRQRGYRRPLDGPRMIGPRLRVGIRAVPTAAAATLTACCEGGCGHDVVARHWIAIGLITASNCRLMRGACSIGDVRRRSVHDRRNATTGAMPNDARLGGRSVIRRAFPGRTGPAATLASPLRGCSSGGRALPWHGRGQGFESPQLHCNLLNRSTAQMHG